MIRTLSILLFCLIWKSNVVAQIHTKSLDFENIDKRIELPNDDKIGSKSLIIKNGKGDVIKTFELLYAYENLYSFNEYYKGDRNFAIIGGRYIFYIVNVSTNKLIGPIRPSWKGEAEDAQSGMLYVFKVIKDGQYLFVNAADNGLTCYSLLDLYNPKEVDFYKSDSPYAQGNYIFIDQRKENIFNGFTASTNNNYYEKVMDCKILFHGYRFELTSEGKLDYEITKNKILILKQILGDSQSIDFLIDLKKGEIIKDN